MFVRKAPFKRKYKLTDAPFVDVSTHARAPCPPIASCVPACKGGMVWTTCGSYCYPTCANPNPVCIAMCSPPKCQCPPHRRIFDNGRCITKAQCHFLSRSNYSFAVVKYPYTLRPVLTLNAAGWVVSGTIAALQEAVLAGKAMYALIGNDTQTDLLTLNNVGVKEYHVTAQSINRVCGHVVVTRRALDTAVRLADVHRQAAVSWLVDDCWTLALVHDGAGQVEQGSLECFRGAVRAGHMVRLPWLQDNVAEVDGLQIRNGVVSGYFLCLFSDDNLHVNVNDVSAQNTVSISLTTAADNADDIDF
ncbi:hypothetical protein LSAT2_027058 [Lamellibrachia satsuma]|nr:hypothetical protein LSAT2_027058 [Lamellibrachia satsuma]